MTEANSISPDDLQKLVKTGHSIRLLDVRSASEFKERHVPFAEHFPVDRIEAGEFVPGENELIVTACGSGGGRSERSARLIAELSGRPVHYLEGGTFGWFKHESANEVIQLTFRDKLAKLGHSSGDSENEKLKKTALLYLSFPFAIAGILWGFMYFYKDLIIPGLIPFSYGILSLVTIAHFIVTKKFKFFRFSQVILVLLLPFFLQLSLGGFQDSSAVIIWAIISPLAAMAFYDVKKSLPWFVAFAVVVVGACILNDFLPSYDSSLLPEIFINRMFLMNVLGVSSLIYFMQYNLVGKQVELKAAVEHQNAEIEEKNREITDSINYAKRIQFTLLANENLLKENLKDHFILFKPKDIVSGDFYWAAKRGDNFYLAVCDSTGHGVPGAFMSLLNSSFLNEAINEKGIEQPALICNYVRQKLVDSISKDGGQDGMDGILICWNRKQQKLSYAAAHNCPFIVRGRKGLELAADKMPVGIGEKNTDFKLHVVDVYEGDKIYLFTDGYADQFGGPKGKKFKYKQLHELLVSLNDVTFEEQKNILDAIITEWRGPLDQTDDILVLGLSLE
jgi:serine phosphatase RsbU (regulator of sigma subunit)/rhodanese-related sulfurtransferase